MRSVSDVTVRGLETTFVFFAGMQVNLFKCFCAKIYITVICIKLGDVVHVSTSLCMVLCLSKFLFLSYHFRHITTSICRMCLQTAVRVVSD